ncbi:hypothetical protein DS745_03835 [Anaerobacillus alkaliphilus]|uniref:Uncharacterized protein n=1 Tax=Anaerobacillus alkaliphilus TaxID=1548597 RepID=A0A4Q0VXP5_9BACI|nr:hypothetical protein [Anaerobacillus alkaliphilus]RXJ04523.1 hypothetical protein DS745_03835 [Anaerobacillus alkaliphilus]
MKKVKVFLGIGMVISIIVLSYQLVEANTKIQSYKEKEVSAFSFAILNYSNVLSSIAMTLADYNEDFTEGERVLYERLLSSHGYRLNHIGRELTSLRQLYPEDLIYEQYVYFIEHLLFHTKRNFPESRRHEIGEVILEYSDQIRIFSFDTKKLLSNDIEMRRLLDLISAMNEDVSKFVY